MATLTRNTHVLDATGMAPGRLATKIAHLLIGKHKVTFMPNVDAGDIVEVINASKIVPTGTKLDTKVYSRHTGWPGGFRQKSLKTVMAENPAVVIEEAVSRMLPKNSHRVPRMNRLTIKL